MVDHLFSSANGHGGFQRAGHNQGACTKAKQQKRLQAASKRLQKGAGEAKRNATRPTQSSVRYPWLGEDQQPVANLWIWPARLTTATRWKWRYVLYKNDAQGRLEPAVCFGFMFRFRIFQPSFSLGVHPSCLGAMPEQPIEGCRLLPKVAGSFADAPKLEPKWLRMLQETTSG